MVPAIEASKTLVIVPGMCDAGYWAPNTCAIARELGWDAHFVNLKSSGNVSAKSFADYVAMVKDDVALQPKKVTLLGHSMGGLIAQKVAEEMHGSVHALLLLESAPPFGILPLSGVVIREIWRYVPDLLFGDEFLPGHGSIEKLWLNHVPEEYRNGLLGSYVPESGKVLRELLLRGVRVDAKKVEKIGRTLVMAGQFDLMLPLPIQQKIAERYKAQLRILPHGHQPMRELGWRDTMKNMLKWAA